LAAACGIRPARPNAPRAAARLPAERRKAGRPGIRGRSGLAASRAEAALDGEAAGGAELAAETPPDYGEKK
jgi:hypothetical protein